MSSNWFKSLFKKKKQEKIELTISEKIDIAISKCKDDKLFLTNEIDEIKKWATDAIVKVYEIPNRYRYKEFEEYGSIKKERINKDVIYEVKQKCDEIVNGYLNQIKLRESKVKLLDSLLSEYENTQNKIYEAEQKLQNQIEAEEKIKELEKHSDRLYKMNESTTVTENYYDESSSLTNIKSELKSIEDDFEIKEEVQRQMKKLSSKYKDDTNNDNLEIQQQEIDELIKNVSNKL